jgi:hypothetical protein
MPTRRSKTRKFIVSVASNVGGGRLVLEAKNAREAAMLAVRNKLGKRTSGLEMDSVDVIVTDTTEKSGSKAQTFWGKKWGAPLKGL